MLLNRGLITGLMQAVERTFISQSKWGSKCLRAPASLCVLVFVAYLSILLAFETRELL